MGVRERQIARAEARAAELTAGITPQVSAQGARDLAAPSLPSPDISGFRAAPEDIDPAAAEGLATREQFIPVLENAGIAFQLAEILHRNSAGAKDPSQFTEGMSPERYRMGLEAVARFNEANPGALEAERKRSVIRQFESDIVDSSPHTQSSFEEKERRRKQRTRHSQIGGAIVESQAPKFADLPEDSRERVMFEEEKKGLDTTSGFGDNILDIMEAAVQFDSPRVRRNFMEGAVRDEIEAAGITLPEDFQPVRVNENLGEVMFLKPTEDGKLRWTLADANVARFRDLGEIADPSELFSVVGSVVGTVATRNRAGGEFVGDLVGRNLGLAIEAGISSGEITAGDWAAAAAGTPFESAFETAVSRGVGRLVGGKKTLVGEEEELATLQANVAETAEVMTTVEDITGRALSVTPAEASGSTKALIEQASKKKNLPARSRQALEAESLKNRKILEEANDKINQPSAGSPGDYDPYQVIQETDAALKAANEVDIPPFIVREEDALGDTGAYIIHYQFAGDTAVTETTKEFSGTPGVTLRIDPLAGEAMLLEAFAGDKSVGNTMVLLEKAWQEAGDKGFVLGTDDSVSASAVRMMTRMEKLGWTFRRNPKAETAPNGNVATPDRSPAFSIEGAPGQVVLSKEFAEDGFDRMAVEANLDEVADLLPAAQEYANATNVQLRETIGWSDQRRVSNYTVENPRTTGLRGQIRQIQNRIHQSLTGAEASEGDKVLGAVVRKETDEEGLPFLTGLAGDELDFGNLLNARDKLGRIAAETGDEDVIAVVNTIDNLLKNGKVNTVKGNPVAASTRANLNQSIDSVRKAEALVTEANNLVNGNAIFKRNSSGEFLYTNVKDWDTLLSGGARFMKTMKPILDANPGLREGTAKALREQYRLRVTEGGWSRAKHDKFLQRYSESLPVVFEESDLLDLARFELQGTKSPWEAIVARQEEKAMRAYRATVGKAAPTSGVPDYFKINPAKIMEAFKKRPFGEVRSYVSWAKRNDPKMFAQLQDTLKEQVRLDLNSQFFNPEKGVPRNGGAALSKWFQGNKEVLREVLGNEYTTQLNGIVRANTITLRGNTVRGAADETQTIITRIFRSLIGPLSRPQRQLTAAQFARTRIAARKAMQMLSSPEAVRAISLAAKNGVTMESQAGIAVMTRLGLFAEFGIVGDPQDPAFQRQALDLYRTLEDSIISSEEQAEE